MSNPVAVVRALVLRVLLAIVAVLLTAPFALADSVTLFAAGSLKGALTEIAAEFTRDYGIAVTSEFGPSGTLREKIEAGAPVGVFASADMGHPRKLVMEGKADADIRFTGNSLCALARQDLGLTTTNFLAKALDPAVKLGTSTPVSDPGGDYTWMMFDKAEAVHAGAAGALKAKALQLAGSPKAGPTPPGQDALAYLTGSGKADMFISYCTSARQAASKGNALAVVDLPPALSQLADYGLVVVKPATPQAMQLALFILSEKGQAILAKWGFKTSAAKP